MPRRGFTLIELLVVITIIVVLLALLTPALDKAIYQAELAVCASKVRGIALAATTYASANKRSYPDRETYRNGSYKVNRPKRLWNATGNKNYFDQRRYIRPYVASINEQFQCPMLPEINLDVPDIEKRAAGELCNSSYQFWYGWQYSTVIGGTAVSGAGTVGGTPSPTEKGMMKLGDRFSYTANGRQYFFDVIANDHDLVSAPGTQPAFDNMTHGSHPDKAPRQTMSVIVQDEEQLHWTRWQGPYLRGLIDMNFARTDNSVQRFDDVALERDVIDHAPDERMARVPEGTADEWPGWRNTLPPASP